MITLAGNEKNSFLMISGQIRESKRNEFEQTFRLIAGSMPADCIIRSLSNDISKEGYYHFFSLWLNENALKRFTESVEYQMMNGAFHALGAEDHSYTGILSEMKSFSGRHN